MIDTSDPYSAFEQHQRVGCVTCCLSAEITQRSQGLGLFPLCCSRELAGTTICCSLLLDTGLGRGLLTELGTPKQGDGWKKVLCHQHRAKLVSSAVPQWPPASDVTCGHHGHFNSGNAWCQAAVGAGHCSIMSSSCMWWDGQSRLLFL